MPENNLFVSVDMDEYYFCRWATGSRNSLWKDYLHFFKDVYGSDKPAGEIHEATEKILELFDSLNFKSTFFFTGVTASYYPELVKKIASGGHEIASHNFYHLDYEYEERGKFRKDLSDSRKLLQDLSGQKIIGYRSPNSSIPSSIVQDLIEAGFKYDSSVTPTRRLFGKFGKFTKAPLRPYRPSNENIGEEGDSGLWEFPWAVFPVLKLPAGSGIMHRIGGNTYNSAATAFSMNRGDIAYYFHPYEISDMSRMKQRKLPLKVKIFLRNTGKSYFNGLKKMLSKYRERLVNGETLLRKCREQTFS